MLERLSFEVNGYDVLIRTFAQSGLEWNLDKEQYDRLQRSLDRSDQFYQQEMADPDSVFHYYQHLIALRRSSSWSDIIVYGHYELLAPENPQVFAYTREYEGRKLLVICNLSSEKVSFEIPDSVSWTQADRLIGNYEHQELARKTELRPWEAEVWAVL